MMWLVFLLIIPCFSWTQLYQPSDRCETTVHCTARFGPSFCLNQWCTCQRGFRFDGLSRCVPDTDEFRFRRQVNYAVRMLGEDCQWSNQCRRLSIDTTKVCLEQKCQCASGYIPIDTFRCVRDFEPITAPIRVTKSSGVELAGYGSPCSTTDECQHITNQLVCFNETCLCLEGFVPLGRHLCYDTRGSGSAVARRSTSSSTRTTPEPVNNVVIKSLGKIGNSCTNDYFCRRTIPESHCYNGKCACLEGLIPLDQYTCVKNANEKTSIISTFPPVDYKSLLGGQCLTHRNCHTSNAICLESICACPNGYFPIDDWSCLPEPDSSDEESEETTSKRPATTKTTTPLSTTEIISTTTTVFRWWPWSPSSTTRQTKINSPNTFRVRCLLNRQCASMDKNSHCTLFGRCICNRDYQLETTHRGQHCVRRLTDADDCD